MKHPKAPYAHPGPSDEQLQAPPARREESPPPVRSSREERELRQALAASLASSTSSTAAALGALDTEYSVETDCAPVASLPVPLDRALLENEFFWVDSQWLRQWVVGEHLPPPGESASTVTGKASSGRGSRREDPLVLDGDGPTATDPIRESGVGAVLSASMEEEEGGEGTGKASSKDLAKVEKEAVAMVPGAGDAQRGGAGGADRGVERGAAEERGSCREEASVSEVGDVGDATPVAAKPGVCTADTLEQPTKERGEEEAAGDVQTLGEKVDAVNDRIDGGEGSDDASSATTKGCPQSSTCPTLEAGGEGGWKGVAAGLGSGGVFRGAMRHLPLLCEHGGLHPASVSRLKLVTRGVYEGLLSEEGMPPPDHHLAATNYRCEECVKDHIGQK